MSMRFKQCREGYRERWIRLNFRTLFTVKLLKSDPVPNGSQIVAQVNGTRGLHAREHTLLPSGGGGSGLGPLSSRLGLRLSGGGLASRRSQ